MKRIKLLLKGKKTSAKVNLDDKSIFYIFRQVVQKEYGSRGVENVTPQFFKKKTLFLQAKNSNWANEIWMNRRDIIRKINKEIGTEEVEEIKIKN
ncbi:MAG: DciA family protein [Candidatus Moranbacteria bacterium]|nr:DciA family protein [Candidatus Moranbacteria bacterium]